MQYKSRVTIRFRVPTLQCSSKKEADDVIFSSYSNKGQLNCPL